VAAVLAGLALPMRPAAACELELILAVDVSGSVNAKEYRLQSRGLADAFRSEDIIHLIHQTSRRGAVYVTLLQWSGSPHQKQMSGWQHLHDKASVLAFAERIETSPREFINYSTAIGEMMAFAGGLFDQRPGRCRRRVVDVSGDGPKNEGREVAPARERLLQSDVTINGLAIIGEEEELAGYYRSEVIGGNGAFMMTAETFNDFPDAIRRKLLREIAPPITELAPSARRQANLEPCPTERRSC
jgi:Ca-activated chloride channel family protein